MFTKITKIFVLTFFIATFFSICDSTRVFAADVWVNTSYSADGSRTDWYILSHRIKEDANKLEFMVPLKIVVDGERRWTRPHAFKYMNGSWYSKYMESSMDWNLVTNDANDLSKKMFDACIPYCNLAQQYPIY